VKPVHQVLPAAAPGDAVTGQAFAWQALLAEWGRPGEIVAEHVHPDLLEHVHPLHRDGKRLLNEGNLVLRYSVWSKTVDAALEARGRVALVYHNITPGNLLRDFNPTLADLCDRGRESLTRFRGSVAAAIADSSFNAADLTEAGIEGARVVPLLLDLPEHAESRRANEAEPLVLTVGRIVPNKRLEDVIKVFALYQRHRAPGASLVIVGSAVGFENYRHALDRLVEKIGVERVSFTGSISSAARDAWYQRADAYLSMSVHEGFCAPLIEALANGAPVVARGAGAVPETLGPAGLCLDVEDELPVAAEALHELVSSDETRSGLAAAAERRMAELRRDALAPRIKAALGPLLDAS
jgi:glycosyltransferase involved in cell wall biosynthesis